MYNIHNVYTNIYIYIYISIQYVTSNLFCESFISYIYYLDMNEFTKNWVNDVGLKHLVNKFEGILTFKLKHK